MRMNAPFLSKILFCDLDRKNHRLLFSWLWFYSMFTQNLTVAKNATTASDGKVYQVDYYNLDVIISVGYRVKSMRGVQFRQWATQTLKQFLVQGYAINQKRLQEKGVEFSQAVALLSQTLTNQALISDEGKAVIGVVQDYARTWSLLQAYDEQNLAAISVQQPEMKPLVFEDVLTAISQLKQELIAKGEATESVFMVFTPKSSPACQTR
ncbi:filamentation induced by cAMP protein fic [Glaesserella parasuis ZJ0906]|uniref:Filamentation induced by cAMP protein fic n=2 Tax=Glaesserella parasuis TaxID=738 RepID=A0A806JEW5_GLAPU|nr:filamentation induced by cAMP protein fic [Glaesserella parasuis ZJ0906]